MKKVLIATGIAVMAFASIASAQGAVFNTNLTVGSTGPDVANLQTWLITNGFSIPSIASGAAAKGYFGAQTKTAVMAYQASRGIPATGFVGPLTRGALNAGGAVVVTPPTTIVCPVGYNCTPQGGTVVPPGTVVVGGTEGQLVEIDNASADIETSLDEGENNVKVFGVEVEAEDSAMTIDRIDVDFTLADAANGSDDLEDYITEVSLYKGDTKLATKDVDEADINDGDTSDDLTDDDNDVYSFRFTGLKAVVAEDDSEEFYVAVSAANSIDSDDAGDEWAVIIPDDGIRATDTAGISDTYVSGTEVSEENFSIEAAEEGDLDLSADSGDNEDRVVVLNSNSTTNGIEIMQFTLESNTSDNIVDEIGINIGSTTATSTSVVAVIQRVHLYADGKLVASESLTADTSGADYGANATFDNLDLTIDEDDEVVFIVKADFKDDADTREGYEFETTVVASTIDAEDAEGDDVDVTDDVIGGEIELRTTGISAKLISTSAVKTATADAAGEADIGTFKIVFSVTAHEDDIYLGRTVTADADSVAGGSAGNGFMWATTTDSTVGSTSLSASISSAADSDDTTSLFKIDKGSTRTFELSVDLSAGGADGYAAVGLTAINWTTDATDTTPDNFYTTGLTAFGTSNLSLYTF
jgi:hypothetical protein